MFATVRLSFNIQVNTSSRYLRSQEPDAPSHVVYAPQRYVEIQITWNSEKLNRMLWKTKKFYDSRSVASYSDTALGKSYAYANKLLSGKWLTSKDYNAVWEALLKLEYSQEYVTYAQEHYPDDAFVAPHRMHVSDPSNEGEEETCAG